MFYDENGKHVRTKKEILDEAGQLRKGCKIIPKGEVYERTLFTIKDSRFKNDRFLDEVKRSYTDLINIYVKGDKQKLRVFDRNGVYLPTKKIGKNNPKAEQIRTDNQYRTMWNQTVDRALISGVPEEQILEVKQSEIGQKVKASIQKSGRNPALFKSLIMMAIYALELWLIIPVFITFRMPNLIVAIIMMISMLIQLTVAILKGWFKISVKKTIVSLWAVFMFLPIMLLFVMYTFHLLAEYQEARIRSFFSASGEGFYLTSMLRTFSKDILFVGNSGNDVIGSLPEFNSDYIFYYILNSYGSIAGIVVVAVLAALVMFIFGASIKQKNELGMVMGFGCGMIILLNILLNLLGALGIIPPASSFLPFLSIGRSNILLCYALVGIIMSIYRYKDVYPKKIRASQVSFQKTINI